MSFAWARRWMPLLFASVLGLTVGPVQGLPRVGAQQHEGGTEVLGEVHFPTSCSAAAQAQFDRGVALLHSFFYPETSRAFTAVTEIEPGCAMGYWGLAMSVRQNPLIPVGNRALQPGWEAIERASEIGAPTERERDWIAALRTYYRDLDTVDHGTRVLRYEEAMEQLVSRYPDDVEAAVFYALAINEATDLSDRTYARQLTAGAILERLLAVQPNHPGVAHYLIHTYDFSALAARALPAAHRYAAIAPSAPHALHMPSHTFSMLGMWQEVIDSNAAAEAAVRSNLAEPGPPRSFHLRDFAIHAHLQLAQDREARRIVDARNALEGLGPASLTTETGFAAIPVRYVIDRGRWDEAAALDVGELTFPQARAIIHFGRALGAARAGAPASARDDREQIGALRDVLTRDRETYWAGQVEVQRLAAEAWVAKAEGRPAEAVTLMRLAADLEDASEKHIAMENRLVPMRELLGELLLEVNEPAAALAEFEASLREVPNRFRSFFGAARAAEMVGDLEKSAGFYRSLLELTAAADTQRPEVLQAQAFMAR